MDRQALIRIGAIAALTFGAVMTVLRLRGITSADLQWSGARLLLQGQDPYAAFLAGDMRHFVLSQHPNYLPLLYLVLLPLALLSLTAAGLVWAVLCLVLALAACIMLGSGRLSRWAIVGIFGALLMSEPFSVTLGNGQFGAVVLFCAALGARKVGRITRSMSLSFLITKYSFAPFALIPIMRRRWDVLVLTTIAEMGAVAVFCALTGSAFTTVIAAPLQVSRHMARGMGDVMTLTQILGGSRAIGLAAALITVIGLAWLGKRAMTDVTSLDALAVAALISLVAFPHLQYDYCVMLPVLVAGLQRTGVSRTLILTPVVIVWLGWYVGGLIVDPYRFLGVLEVLSLTLLALFSLLGSRGITIQQPSPGGAFVAPAADAAARQT